MSELLNLSRTARRFGVTREWLREQVEAGKIPYLPTDGEPLFNPVLVAEALASRATQYRKQQEGDANE